MKGTPMAISNEDRRGLNPIGWGSHRWDSLYVSLVPLPAAFIMATLVSDLLYCATDGAFWSQASKWLLAAGLATSAFAAADGLIRYIASGGIRPSKISWTHVLGNVLASVLSLSNLVYRLNEDRAQAVVPAGIALTAIAVGLLLLTARLNRDIAMEDAVDELNDFEPIWDEVPAPQAADPIGAAPAESYPVLSEVLVPPETPDPVSAAPAECHPVSSEVLAELETAELASGASAEARAVSSDIPAPAQTVEPTSTAPAQSDPICGEGAAPTWPLGGVGAAPVELDTIWGEGSFAPGPVGAAAAEPDPIREEDVAPASAVRASAGKPAAAPPAPRGASASRPRKRRGGSSTAAAPVTPRADAPPKKRRTARARPVTQC